MPNEKIKEILEKISMKLYGGDSKLSVNEYNALSESLQEYGEFVEQETLARIVNKLNENGFIANIIKNEIHIISDCSLIRQQTLEEAIKCVPEEKFCQTQPMVTDYANINNALLTEGVMKWNDCRQKTLSNLQALKDKK